MGIFFDDPDVARQRDRFLKEATRPRARQEPPNEPAAERTPSIQQVLHRAEALTAVDMPVDCPPTPMNDTGKIAAMARMGGEVPVWSTEQRERRDEIRLF